MTFRTEDAHTRLTRHGVIEFQVHDADMDAAIDAADEAAAWVDRTLWPGIEGFRVRKKNVAGFVVVAVKIVDPTSPWEKCPWIRANLRWLFVGRGHTAYGVCVVRG